MSLLSEYEQRTAWKYEPIHGSFGTHEGLTEKVRQDGKFAPFHGSTVVFRAGDRCAQFVQRMRRFLYSRLDGTGMLAELLPGAADHMTLHDLVSPEVRTCGSKEEYDDEVWRSVLRAADVVEGIRKEYACRKIAMVPDRIVNMVSKSLVLMLHPQTEEDFELLMELYHRFDDIQCLPYPLTPHITLAYFRPGMLDGDRLGEAVNAVQSSLDKAPVFEFHPEELTAQSFLDMAHFQDIPERICLCCDGGLNRSVLAAQILNDLAQQRNLPAVGEARASFPDTEGWPVPEQVFTTLENNGIHSDRTFSTAKALRDDEVSCFSSFAAISDGAADRLSMLCLPDEKVYAASRFFYGVRDPEYGEITLDQAFKELYDRVDKYLDAFELICEKHMGRNF